MTAVDERTGPPYGLLPALYRIADVDQGGPLRELMALIGADGDALHADIRQLWEDFFIETCRPWVVPYIGDLVATTPVHALDDRQAAATAEALFGDLAGPDLRAAGAIRTRADVAKTISYRRRKGTPAMLEELAHDVTGWGAHVVEFLSLLDWQQHLEHPRPDRHGCPDLRRVDAGDRVGGPWDTAPHTVDVRPINEWDGWHNIPNIGFFLWRLRAYRLTDVTPVQGGNQPWQLAFSPLRHATPLFSAGRVRGASRLATEENVEAPIRPPAFFEDRAAYYGDPSAGGSVLVKRGKDPVPVGSVCCMNLATWPSQEPKKLGIDVARGRLVVPSSWVTDLTVSYHYGFGAPIGGGEYDRRKWLVRRDRVAPQSVDRLGGGGALAARLGSRSGAETVVEIHDSATYTIPGALKLAAGESLTIQAADGSRPHVRVTGGQLTLTSAGAGASLTLGGLAIEGRIRIAGELERLRLLHTTLVPSANAASVAVDAAVRGTALKVEMAYSITGGLRLPTDAEGLWLLDSIVDGGGADAVAGDEGKAGPPAHIERSTLLGGGRFMKLPLASETIFSGPVAVEQRQQGCVRFSYLPVGSSSPQQYRCQPALETARRVGLIRQELARRPHDRPRDWEKLVADEVASWLVPSFESERYGDPGYARLRRTSPIQIRTGGADGSEMGVYCGVKEPQRASNLALRLEEYLPVGLDAGIVYVT